MDCKECEKKLSQARRHITLLARASARYFDFSLAAIDYKQIMEDLLEFSGADCGLINIYTKERDKLITKGFAGLDGHLDTLEELLGIPVYNSEWDVSAKLIASVGQPRLTKVANLYEATFSQIPAQVCQRIEQLLELQQVYQIILYHGQEILGNILLCYRREKQPQDKEVLELFISVIGTVLLRKQAEEQLQEKYHQLQAKEEALRVHKQTSESLIQHYPDAIVILDNEQRIVNINEKFTQMFEYELEDCLGLDIDKVVANRNKSLEAWQDANTIRIEVEKNQKIQMETIRVAKSGRIIPVVVRGGPTLVDGKIIGYHGIYTDISERKKAEEKIKYLSYHDKLTGLFNRAYFEEQLRLWDQPVHLPLSIIIGDVNGLKLTNDVFGHLEGDRLLIKIADILQEVCGKNGVAARWGGDEFVVVFPKCTQQQVVSYCEAITQKCEDAKEDPIKISIALGWATKTTEQDNIYTVIKDAEEKMYRHKLLESKSTRSNIIASLQKSLHERNLETAEHCKRLQALALRLGREVELLPYQLDELSLLGILHDIGNIAIDDSILTKSGRLTQEEWEMLKAHPEIGYRIAQTSQELFPIAEYILSHHEHWDGGGYPRGLKGEQIPLLARILAIADAYDAMTSYRTYRQPMTHEEALIEIEKGAGSQFDPQLVNSFIKLFQSSEISVAQ